MNPYGKHECKNDFHNPGCWKSGWAHKIHQISSSYIPVELPVGWGQFNSHPHSRIEKKPVLQLNPTDFWEVTWLLPGRSFWTASSALQQMPSVCTSACTCEIIHMLATTRRVCSFQTLCISARLSVYSHGAERLRRQWGCLAFRMNSPASHGSANPLPHSNSSCTKWGTDCVHDVKRQAFSRCYG